MTADGWTISEACEQLSQTGLPIPERSLRGIVRYLPGFKAVGEKRKPAGSKGGRGDLLYQIGDLQRLHSALAPWLTKQGP